MTTASRRARCRRAPSAGSRCGARPRRRSAASTPLARTSSTSWRIRLPCLRHDQPQARQLRSGAPAGPWRARLPRRAVGLAAARSSTSGWSSIGQDLQPGGVRRGGGAEQTDLGLPGLDRLDRPRRGRRRRSTLTDIAGCAAVKSLHHRGQRFDARAGHRDQLDTAALESAGRTATAAFADSRSRSTWRAGSMSWAPASERTMPRPTRWNSGTPELRARGCRSPGTATAGRCAAARRRGRS